MSYLLFPIYRIADLCRLACTQSKLYLHSHSDTPPPFLTSADSFGQLRVRHSSSQMLIFGGVFLRLRPRLVLYLPGQTPSLEF
jgi:hypothetical protein